MAKRRATIILNVDLMPGSKEAHMVTVEKIARSLGEQTRVLFREKGYSVQQIKLETMLHYVRHHKSAVIFQSTKRILKRVS